MRRLQERVEQRVVVGLQRQPVRRLQRQCRCQQRQQGLKQQQFKACRPKQRLQQLKQQQVKACWLKQQQQQQGRQRQQHSIGSTGQTSTCMKRTITAGGGQRMQGPRRMRQQ